MTAKDEYLALDAEARAAYAAGDERRGDEISDRMDGHWYRMTREDQAACRLELSRRNAAEKQGGKK